MPSPCVVAVGTTGFLTPMRRSRLDVEPRLSGAYQRNSHDRDAKSNGDLFELESSRTEKSDLNNLRLRQSRTAMGRSLLRLVKPHFVGMLLIATRSDELKVGRGIIRLVAVLVVVLMASRTLTKERLGNERMKVHQSIAAVFMAVCVSYKRASQVSTRDASVNRSARFANSNLATRVSFVSRESWDWEPFINHAPIISTANA